MDALRKSDWSFFKDKTWRDLLKREYWPDIARHFGLITTLYWALSLRFNCAGGKGCGGLWVGA